MRHAPFIATRLVSFETARERPKQRKNIFRIILEALHHSRRLQAERTLHQYRHLIQKAESNSLCALNKCSGAKDHVDE
jgi:hypothetical protein